MSSFDSMEHAGLYDGRMLEWDGKDEMGRNVVSGTYNRRDKVDITRMGG